MTTEEEIILVQELIKEDPEITIKEYLEILAEIEAIKPTLKKAS